MWEERDKLRKELQRTKEPALDDLEDSRPIQIVYFRNSVTSVAGQSLAKEIRCVISGSYWPFQEKSRLEMGLSRKSPWKTFLSDGFDLCELHWTWTRFLKILCQQKPQQPGLKGTEKEWRRKWNHEGRNWGWWDLLGPTRWWAVSSDLEDRASSPMIILRPWNLMELALLVFKTCLGSITPFFLPLSPFWNENVSSVPGYCIL